MEPLNRMAAELVDEAIDFADELGVGVYHLDNDAAVLDFGVEHDGGIEAGLLLAEVRTGGLATVQTGMGTVDGAPVPHVELSTDRPALALLESGLAAWPLDVEGFEGLGSGPARRLAAGAESFDLAVLAVEADALPDEAVAAHVAEEAGVPASGVFLPTAPVASLAGSVAVAAAAAEVALRRFERLGNDPESVLAATASAPLAPLGEGNVLARANDALAYGSRVHLVVDREPDRVADLPFGATDYAGRSFADLLEGRDLLDLDDAFAPAAATVDVRGGPTHVVGGVDEERLAERLGL